MDFVVEHSYLIPLLPLLGAAAAGFFGARWLKGRSHWPIWVGVGCSAVLSLVLLFGMSGAVSKLQAEHEAAAAQSTGRAEAEKAGVHYTQITSPSEPYMRGGIDEHPWFTWIDVGNFRAVAGALLDPLSAVMLCVVCGIGFLITVFAAGYMKGEEGYFR